MFAENIKEPDHLPQTEKQIIDRYDKIEMDDKEEANIDEIKKLYEQSKKLNFSEGILRGLIIQQQVAATQKTIPFPQNMEMRQRLLLNKCKIIKH
jgi:hypothetical protein